MGVPHPQREPKTVVIRSDVTRRRDTARENVVLNANGEPVTWADVDGKPEEPGLLLGRYSVLETRASGGFGMVQVCWDTRLQRRVAIKLIPLADPDDPNILASSIQDAISEARTASMLGHPNIVTVLDFENDDDYAYLVMEYVNGLTLTELLQRVEGGVLTFEECAHVVRSVSAALAFSHENGVLHLDIKPSNILIDRMGTVKLGDFGMAALASAAGYGGARGGTVGYMPPEQIAGDMVDERCDVFSFAVVLWQALSGSNPFAANTAGESFDRIRKGPQVPLSKIDPEIPLEVEDIFGEALEPDPSDRMVSVEEFGNRLVAELGDPDAGQESLRRLLDQLSDDEENVYPTTHERIPLLVRMPWLEEALIRFFTAASSGYLTWLLSEALIGGVSTMATATMVRIGATIAGAVLGACLPSAIGLLLGILLAATFVFGPFAGAYPVQGGACAVLVVFLTASWWLSSGKGRMLSGLSVSAAASLSQPIAGVSLSGWGLEPIPALLTSVFSWLLYRLVDLSVRTGFHAGLVVEGLVSMFRTPDSWIWMAGLGISALVCSFLCGRNRRWLAIIGQILGTTGACFTYACTRTLENNGIWVFPDQGVLVPAVLFCVSVSVAIIVFGPPQSDQEVN